VALRICVQTDEDRAGALDELAECLRETPGHGDDGAMLSLAFRRGAMPPALGERLVRARLLSPPQAKSLEDPRAEIRQLIGAHVQGAASAPVLGDPGKECTLGRGATPDTVELRCFILLRSGSCGTRGLHATFLADPTGLRLTRVEERGGVDDGACGGQ
jgi:hypothetical protein